MDSWRQQQEQEEQQQEEEHMAEQSIYKVISAVQKDIASSGVSKGGFNQKERYAFRKVDDIYNSLSPLLAKHGLIILPRILSYTTDEKVAKSGAVGFRTIAEVELDFVSASDGSIHTVKTYGEALDYSDKSLNKALTSAYKYALIVAFCIPVEVADADSESHEIVDSKPAVEDKENVMAAVKCLSSCANVEALEDVFVNITGGHAKQSEFYKACVNAAKNRKTQLLQEAV